MSVCYINGTGGQRCPTSAVSIPFLDQDQSLTRTSLEPSSYLTHTSLEPHSNPSRFESTLTRLRSSSRSCLSVVHLTGRPHSHLCRSSLAPVSILTRTCVEPHSRLVEPHSPQSRTSAAFSGIRFLSLFTRAYC